MTVKGSKAVLPMLPPPPPVVQTHKKKLSGPNLQQVFNAAKNTLATHPKLCLQLIKVYQKAEFESFFTEFLDLLKVCLVVGEKQPQVERVLSFVARFTTADKTVKKEGQEKEDERQNKDQVTHEKEQESCMSKDDVSSYSVASNDATMETEEEVEEDEVDPFLINMFQFLLSSHEANSNAVRYRVCQLINRILNSMGESASLDDDLFSTIYDTMLQRLMDKKPAVRVQAILALNRLQDPRNKDCPVIKAYRYHLSMDPASDVRRAVLLSTAITFQTLPDVLHRTRDKNHLVRRQAYLVLAQKVHIRSLQISQRVRLLSEGLNDRSDIVRLAVQKNLLQAWLRFVNGSVLDLLTCLDVEASTKGAELALDTLFIDVPASTLVQNFNLLGEDRLLPYENLKPESILYWKCLAKHLKKECAEEELDHILPDLSAFCEYVRAYVLSDDEEGMGDDAQAMAVRQMEREFVLQLLVQLTSCYDLSDEVGRKCLDKLVRTLLVCERVGEASINVLVDVFARLHPPHTRVQQLAEIISDVREPTSTPAEDITMVTVAAATPAATPVAKATGERNQDLSEEEQRANKIKAAKVRVQLNQAREELEECVRSLDLDRAQDLKLQLRALEQQHELLQQQLATPVQTPLAVTSASVTVDMTQSEEVLITDAQKETVAAEEPQEKDDPQTLARCLTIVCQMLRSPEITTVTPTLYSLHDNLLLPCLKNQEPLVRKLAVQALSLLCLVSKELAQKHLLLFVQISQIDIEVIQVLALHAVFDFLLLYGVDEFTAVSQRAAGLAESGTQGDGLDNANTVINVLSKRLDSEESDVRTAVAMGLCKLLQAARVTSPSLLTHLTLLWYNPTTEDDNMLRHMLGVFFPLYAAHGGTNQESVSLSVLPTLRALVDAAPKSPLAQVDIDDVANFLVSITSPAVVTKKVVDYVNQHDSLVFAIFSEMLAHPDSALSRYLVKTLRHLHVSPTNYVNLRQVFTLTEKLSKKFHERGMLAPLEKFQATIKDFLKNAPVKEEKEEEEEVLKLDDKDTTSVTFSDMTMANKSVDGTFARRKRQLYTTQTDGDILSSEAETDNDDLITDIKSDTEQYTLETVTEEDDAHSNKVIRYAEDNGFEKEPNVTVVTGAQEQELQLPTPILDRSLSSDDLFASPVLSGLTAHTPEEETSSDGIDTSGSASRKRGSATRSSNGKPVADSDIGEEVNANKSSAGDFFSSREDTENEAKTPQRKEKRRGSRQSKCDTPVMVTRRGGRRITDPPTSTKTLASATSGGSSPAAPRSGRTRRTKNTSTEPLSSPLTLITSTDEEAEEILSIGMGASEIRSSPTGANNSLVKPLPMARQNRLAASSTSPSSSPINTAIATASSKRKPGRMAATKKPVVDRVDDTITSSCSTPGGSPGTSPLKYSIKTATDSPPSLGQSHKSSKSGVDSSPLQQIRSTRSSKGTQSEGESGSAGLRRNHRGKVVAVHGLRIPASMSTESSSSSSHGSPVRPATKRLRGVTAAVSATNSETFNSPSTSDSVGGARRSARRGQGSITTIQESPANSSPAKQLRRLKDAPTGSSSGSSPGGTASRSTRASRAK